MSQHLQGHQTDPETRAKMSESAKRRFSRPGETERLQAAIAAKRATPAYQAKIAANIAAGVYDTRKGKPVSTELAAKISAGLIAGNYRGERNKMSKPCVCLNTGVRYACIREAAELTGIPQSSISAVLNGHQNTAHGLRFAFVVKEKNGLKVPNERVPPANLTEAFLMGKKEKKQVTARFLTRWTVSPSMTIKAFTGPLWNIGATP